MRRRHLITSLAIAAVSAVAVVVTAAAAPAPTRPAGADPVATPVQYYGYGYRRPYARPYYGGGYGYYRPYARPYYYEAPPPPPVTYYQPRPYAVGPGGDPDAIAQCASRFRSFNVNTGTYITYDGEERLCPYLR